MPQSAWRGALPPGATLHPARACRQQARAPQHGPYCALSVQRLMEALAVPKATTATNACPLWRRSANPKPRLTKAVWPRPGHLGQNLPAAGSGLWELQVRLSSAWEAPGLPACQLPSQLMSPGPDFAVSHELAGADPLVCFAELACDSKTALDVDKALSIKAQSLSNAFFA
eukprot:CAMPEP_0168395568 /NCGR_PEP_ID=MMETSP0228-20121227/20114_1 /TAXON_ID=133427 /ORGANISM="Protoceratium reticulatum, Strain CCCM 535 (=CCMP 1889)" /LENGTH=170 /DNA_ID=CAMNT_0008409011 /DNA_START=84 /DNA_END=597 /DNA_ORIENTATION=+